MDETSGQWLYNSLDNKNPLWIPNGFQVPKPLILSPPLRDSRLDFRDIIINILGFMPFGFFGLVYFSSIQKLSYASVWLFLIVVFLGGLFKEPVYKSRREKNFIVAVNCNEPGGNCFCRSMQTGPKVAGPFDLALTEVIQGDAHYFIVEAGSEKGRAVMADVPHRPAGSTEMDIGQKLAKQSAARMGRTLDTADIKQLLYRNREHPRWDDVAGRCLACTNCTLVCPTCFCTTVEDVTDLTGEQAERRRRWDSCFTMDFSYIHGGYIRPTVKARYRQWMTHKLASWIDQFGTSGCVGCGRCITWCPVGIDITAEAAAIRADSNSAKTDNMSRNF